LITIRDSQMNVFKLQAVEDFKQRLGAQLGIPEADAAGLDRTVAGAKACGITSERDVARMAGIMHSQAGTVDINLLPKAAQNVLLASGVPPEEKLNRLETLLANKSGGGGSATPAGRFLPLPMTYTVRDGDCIVSIAYEFGFFPDKIWNLPDNENLQLLRKDMHVLNPGDSVYIPEREQKEESRPTDAKHRFRLKGVPVKIRIQFQYFEKPRPKLGYTIRFQDCEEHGTTDDGGWLEHFIPPGLRVCFVTLDDGSQYRLALGALKPVSEAAGVQDRLTALGYYAGPNSGQFDAPTKQALLKFQASHQLDATGEVDDKTRELLVSMAGA